VALDPDQSLDSWRQVALSQFLGNQTIKVLSEKGRIQAALLQKGNNRYTTLGPATVAAVFLNCFFDG
jgi:hypothetical protein